MIRYCGQQRLISGRTAPQCKAADAMMIEIDFTAHQAMKPVGAHGKALAEQMHLAGFVSAANEDHESAQRCVQIEPEVLGHWATWRSCFSRHRGAGAACADD